MKFDIPINITVDANTEQEAEALVKKIMAKGITRYGLSELISYEPFEFLQSNNCSSTKESCCSGRRDNCC